MLNVYVRFIIYVKVKCITKKASTTIMNKMEIYDLRNLMKKSRSF